MPEKQPTLAPVTNEIQVFFHCRQCLLELPPGMSPREWVRHQVGFTRWGLQVWCARHECNVAHIDFEGRSPFPTNTSQ